MRNGAFCVPVIGRFSGEALPTKALPDFGRIGLLEATQNYPEKSPLQDAHQELLEEKGQRGCKEPLLVSSLPLRPLKKPLAGRDKLIKITQILDYKSNK